VETLFRLLLSRQAIAQDDDVPSILLNQDSPFQAELGQAQQSQDPRNALKAVARNFVASAGFVGDPTNLAIHDELKALGLSLDALEQKQIVTNVDVAKAIEDAFGQEPGDLLSSDTIDTAMSSLRDSLVAIKQIPEEHRRPLETLTRQLRDLEVIKKTAASNDFPGGGETLRRYRRRSAKLPGEADLRSSLSTVKRQQELEKQRKETEEKKRKDGEARLELYKRLNVAIGELTNLSGDHLQSTPQTEHAGFLVPAAVRPLQLFIEEMTNRKKLTDVNVLSAQLTLGRALNQRAAERTVPNSPGLEVGAATFSTKPRLARGTTSFQPLPLTEIGFRLKSTAADSLSAGTLKLLKERKLNLTEHPLDHIVESLRNETLELSKELDSLLGRPLQRSFKRMGNALVKISTPMASVWSNMVVSNDLVFPASKFAGNGVPTSHGSIAPTGVADLLVVKQQLVRYEAADVAHIENVLKGEKKVREHSTRRETEEFSFRETETTTSEERELESTTRFELSRETSQTIREDAALKAGLTLSGKYGPSVEFSASAEGSVSRSKEEATKSAANFSQDVTERSATKVTERVLERSSLRVTNEVIEKNSHSLDNEKGTGHISGVYQWVNKVYQAQMFNYGIRMMYDFMVPEPAAFLISTMEGTHASTTEIEKPLPFTLRPDQIEETNYFSWVHQYGATDVTPPPERFKTKSVDFNKGDGDDSTDYFHSGQIQIDEGYRAVFGSVVRMVNIWEPEWEVKVALGSHKHRFFEHSGWGWNTPLEGETDSLPFALITIYVSDIVVAIEVKCERTDRAMLKWRLDTHAKLTAAHKARLSEYEEKLAALEVQAGVAIQGRNPFLNLELINDELKKHCITILTEQHFDLFGAIQLGSFDVPQIDTVENAAEGPYVRFFEQAFEWEQMTWLTYPYFWGRKGQWDERIAYEDVDPIFNQFLKAGYCRVAVPVRPGFEGAIDHFTTYGEIWNGGPLPTISNPLFLPIADEIAERLDRPGDEIPQGDPWLVRIPTTLVRLRPDDQLPKWRQDANGEWVEA
jgi:hypothetical protein